jgi:hypothetical protein
MILGKHAKESYYGTAAPYFPRPQFWHGRLSMGPGGSVSCRVFVCLAPSALPPWSLDVAIIFFKAETHGSAHGLSGLWVLR